MYENMAVTQEWINSLRAKERGELRTMMDLERSEVRRAVLRDMLYPLNIRRRDPCGCGSVKFIEHQNPFKPQYECLGCGAGRPMVETRTENIDEEIEAHGLNISSLISKAKHILKGSAYASNEKR